MNESEYRDALLLRLDRLIAGMDQLATATTEAVAKRFVVAPVVSQQHDSAPPKPSAAPQTQQGRRN